LSDADLEEVRQISEARRKKDKRKFTPDPNPPHGEDEASG
jgi:hypothetical protein